jgi:RNA polymerase sigma factor (sigma-70 family)
MSPGLGELGLTSQSDERLVRLARAGHERAFAVIVERYRPELSAFARRLSRDGKAEDIVQQAFLSAFAALRSGADVKHLRGWLYRIVRNAAARTRVPQSMPLDGVTASGESVEDVVQQRALAMDALAELGRLPRRQRQAMVGTVLDGRGRAEVASSMGVSEGAVRQLVHRARARIRTAVTALTPWPLVRWVTAVRPGSGAAAGAGAGAASSVGVALKLGIVLASGAIATGVTAVEIHRWAHRPRRAEPGAAARIADPQAAVAGDPVLTVAAVARTPVGVDRSGLARSMALAALGLRVRRRGDRATNRPEPRPHDGGWRSNPGSGHGHGAGPGRGAGVGGGDGYRAGTGDGYRAAGGDGYGAGSSPGGGAGSNPGGNRGSQKGGGSWNAGGGQGRDGSSSGPQAVTAADGASARGADRTGYHHRGADGSGLGSWSGAG